MATFKVKLIKSIIGSTKAQKDTIRCLGLKRIRHEVEVKDTPANRGQMYKMQHLLSITKVEK